MPTKPLESILDRELSKAESKELIGIASSVLKELVNNATTVLARCATSRPLNDKEDEDVAILALYRHIIELTDGIEVMISQCCSNAAIPVLRSSFETSLAIEYIRENNSDYVQRSLSWMVGYIHRRVDMFNRIDSSTNKGKDDKKLFVEDLVTASLGYPISPIEEIQKTQSYLQSRLSKPHLQPIEEEYKRQIDLQNSNNIEWYSLFDGPRNLWMLAKHLRRGGHYELLYRQWSMMAHAEDFSSFLTKSNKCQAAIRRIREPSRIREISVHAAVYLLRATRMTINKLHPGEDIAIWYKREIQKPFRELTGRDL